jgi:hypothetical protein
MGSAICSPRSTKHSGALRAYEAPGEGLELRKQVNAQLTRAYHMLVGADVMNSMDCGVDTKIPTLTYRHRAPRKVLQHGTNSHPSLSIIVVFYFQTIDRWGG